MNETMTSESTGEALYAACKAAPQDDAPWLIYADWLEENGQEAKAKRLRTQRKWRRLFRRSLENYGKHVRRRAKAMGNDATRATVK